MVTPAPSTTPRPPAIDIMDATRRVPTETIPWLREHAARAMDALGITGDVRVRIVDDAEMSQTHEEFLGVSGTTDVITFDMRDPEELPAPPRREPAEIPIRKDYGSFSFGIDTDIVVCFDEAGRQSASVGYPVAWELLLYVVHGILHCLGEDDHDEAGSARMHALEDAVLAAVGVGPVKAR